MGKTAGKYLIRLMTEIDVDGVARVERDAFSAPWPPAVFAEELKNPLTHYLVMESKGEIIGYAGFWLVVGEAQVTNIALLKKHHGKGWGTELVEGLVNLAKDCGADSIVLEARKSNFAALNLYQKLGFAVCGVRPKYYLDDGEDALLMGKNLTDEQEADNG